MKSFMNTNRNSNRYGLIAASFLVVASSIAGEAQARDNVSLSIGINVPGVIYPSHAYPVYTQPPVVYVQQRPVYVQPVPVYYQQTPVYYSGPPVYYERPGGWKHGHHKKYKKHDRDDDDRYERHDGYRRGE